MPGAASAGGAASPDWPPGRTSVPPVGAGADVVGEGDGARDGTASRENWASSSGFTTAALRGWFAARGASGAAPDAAAAPAVSSPEAARTATARARGGTRRRSRAGMRSKTTQPLLGARGRQTVVTFRSPPATQPGTPRTERGNATESDAQNVTLR